MQDAIEANYPPTFRNQDTKTLADHITLRHSVELIGMKRVGISNFLRFFLGNKKVRKNYLPNNHIFITVDLNDLVERELFAFWILTFKRIHDTIQSQPKVNQKTKDKIADLFLDAIQTQDLFLTVENIRTCTTLLVDSGIIPTLFLLRFDRMQDVATPQFLSNLQGLVDVSGHKLSYVFTSARPLDQISGKAFPRQELTGFSHCMFLEPLKVKDVITILDSFKKRYNIVLTKETTKTILNLTDGHVQYLHLACVILNENKNKKLNDQKIIDLIQEDEQVALLSEEIWESLTSEEKNALTKIVMGENLVKTQSTQYLWQTGIISKNNQPFTPLFSKFVKNVLPDAGEIEFTKKEHLLYTLLNENQGDVCDRDTIIHHVWPESEEEGVTDWTIDRLVSRLRSKLKKQNSPLQIVTVKTRGYKLT